MARFRRKAKSRRYFPRLKARRRSSKGGGGLNTGAVVMGGAIYGAGRKYLSNLAAPITSKIPLGNVADNLVLGAAAYMLAKKGRGILKDIGKAGLTIEAALAGQDLMESGLGGAAKSDAYVYG